MRRQPVGCSLGAAVDRSGAESQQWQPPTARSGTIQADLDPSACDIQQCAFRSYTFVCALTVARRAPQSWRWLQLALVLREETQSPLWPALLIFSTSYCVTFVGVLQCVSPLLAIPPFLPVLRHLRFVARGVLRGTGPSTLSSCCRSHQRVGRTPDRAQLETRQLSPLR